MEVSYAFLYVTVIVSKNFKFVFSKEVNMKLNNKRTCKDLSVAMNVCILKVEPWVITISSRPGSDNKVIADRAPSHRSNDYNVL